MIKPLLTIIFTALLVPTYSYGNEITCGKKSCDEIANKIFLKPTSQRKVIHLYLVENNIKVPVFADIKNIGAAITTPKNSFHSVYYYGDKRSISVSFFDVDENIDLSSQSNNISVFNNDGIRVFFYEARNSKGHPQEPIFEAIIPIMRGDKDRFIRYVTSGISEEEFKELLSHLELNTN